MAAALSSTGPTGRALQAVAGAMLAGALLAPAGHAAPRRRVRSVTPPAKLTVGASATVGVKANGPVALFAGASRKRTSKDVRLATRLRPKGNVVTVKQLPKALHDGAYFLSACPTTGLKGCVVAKTATIVVPTHAPTLGAAAPTAASSGAASATIGKAGGSIAATGPDGTKYLLAVPAGSLPADTTITMTPLSGAGGTGTFLAGVQLSPAGLEFIHGAALGMRPATHSNIANTGGFLVTPDGKLAPTPLRATRKAGGYLARIGTLGGLVLRNTGKGPTAPIDHARIATRALASDSTGFYEQLLQGEFQQEQSDTGDSGSAEAAIVSTLQDWHMDIVTHFQAAQDDDTEGDDFNRTLLVWAQDGALVLGDGHSYAGGYGADGEWTGEDTYSGMSQYFGKGVEHNDYSEKEVFPYIRTVLNKSYDRHQQKCRDNHDLTEFTAILSRAQNLALLDRQVPDDEITSCLSVKVDFDSSIHVDQPGGGYDWEYVSHLTASATVDGGLKYTASAPGTYSRASGTSAGSTSSFTVTGGNPSTVTLSDFSPANQTPGSPPTVQLSVGSPTENYDLHDSVSGFDRTLAQAFWLKSFSILHQGDAFQDGYLFALNPGSGDVLGQRTYSNPAGGTTESTTITVTHTPKPFAVR